MLSTDLSKSTITNSSIKLFSSWKQTVTINETIDYLHSIKTFQAIFNIPYPIPRKTVLNRTVLLTDVLHNHLLASWTNICINKSSVIINYSLDRSISHNLCLYIVLNTTTVSFDIKEIFTCRTISLDTQANENSINETHHTGPSVTLIVSQSVLIILMMIFIYIIETIRKNKLIKRINRRLIVNRLLKRSKTNVNFDNTMMNESPENRFLSSPIGEQVLAANDLTATQQDRRFTSPSIIDIKELTRRLSAVNKENL